MAVEGSPTEAATLIPTVKFWVLPPPSEAPAMLPAASRTALSPTLAVALSLFSIRLIAAPTLFLAGATDRPPATIRLAARSVAVMAMSPFEESFPSMTDSFTLSPNRALTSFSDTTTAAEPPTEALPLVTMAEAPMASA